MQYILLFIICFGLLILAAGCGKQRPQEPNSPGSTVVSTSGQFLSQEEIRQQLQKIAQSPKPRLKSMGAMCYDIAGPPQYAEYTCPKCGTKTLHSREKPNPSGKGTIYSYATSTLTYDLETCRRQISQIPRLSVELDESQFCKHCSPDIEMPKLVLIVHYPEIQKDHRYAGLQSSDLELLTHFLNGEKKYKYVMDDETAIKDHIDHLEELLGVEINHGK